MNTDETEEDKMAEDSKRPFESIKPNDHKAERRRAVLIIVLSGLLIAAIPLVYTAASMLGRFGARDISAAYDRDDFVQAVNKLGLRFFASDGVEYDSVLTLAAAEAGGSWDKDISYDDYEWTYSDYKVIDAELNDSEFQALVCEASPLAFWTSQLQFKMSGTSMEIAGLLDFEDVLDELYPQQKAELPITGIDRISFYLKAKPSIYENQLELNSEEVKIGPLQIIDNGVMDYNSIYLEKVYRLVPNLIIHDLELTDYGTIRLSMTMPCSISADYKGRIQ